MIFRINRSNQHAELHPGFALRSSNDGEAADPLTFTAIVLLLGLVALLACLIPAQRAMRVDPIVVLRHQ